MQERIPLTEQYLQILQKINKRINRKEFCHLHQISESKLSRILTGKIQPDFELLDYMAMSCGMEMNLFLIRSTFIERAVHQNLKASFIVL